MVHVPQWKLDAAKRRMSFYTRWQVSPAMLSAMEVEVSDNLWWGSGPRPAVSCKERDGEVTAVVTMPNGQTLTLSVSGAEK